MPGEDGSPGDIETGNPVVIFLCGDVMTGRGIDQILPSPADPALFEPYVHDARTYIDLAERAGASIPRLASFSYIWGDTLEIWNEVRPVARIVNLETSITRSDDHWPEKDVHYRMSPGNVRCLPEAGISACSLANNHVLDWGYAGLSETLAILDDQGIGHAGAGRNSAEAAAPLAIDTGEGGRLLLWSCAASSSGVPRSWSASGDRPGVNLLPDLSTDTAGSLAAGVRSYRRRGDLVIASIHWGGNWGYQIEGEQREFAHTLIESGVVDVIHGHSSHHVMGIEVYRGKLILYGCGDFLNDYEGIGGFEQFRGGLGLMYFPALNRDTGELAGLCMYPTRIEDFRLSRAASEDVAWLSEVLSREGTALGTRVNACQGGGLCLGWDSSSSVA